MKESLSHPENGEILEDISIENKDEEQDIDSTGVIDKSAKHMKKDDNKDADAVVDISSSLNELSKQIEEMNSLFVSKIQHTAHEEKIVDQMHAELQKYKNDMYSQLVRPILMDIIDMRDSILRMSKNYSSKSEGEQNVPLKVFSGYAFDVQDILEKNNISIYEGVKGDCFLPMKQRVIKKTETTVPDLNGKIAESLSPGYDYMGKTISPEKVAVYSYKKPQEVKGENE